MAQEAWLTPFSRTVRSKGSYSEWYCSEHSMACHGIARQGKGQRAEQLYQEHEVFTAGFGK